MKPAPREYSLVEEVVHAVTHGAGVILSVIGLSWMLYLSIGAADPWRIAASIIYGLTLIALFLTSTLYHALHWTSHKRLFKLLDHCAIYLMIAGTYTPFLLVSMRGDTGWLLLAAIWSLAVAGIVSKLYFRHRFPKLGLASYLLMGWLVVVAGPKLAAAVGPDAMNWLIIGGLAYTIGAGFYAAKRFAYTHAVWHVFVLIGGFCHFAAVIWYVLPATEAG